MVPQELFTADGYAYQVNGVIRVVIEISGLETSTKGFCVITANHLIGSAILIRNEKLVLEDNRARVKTPVTKVHQTGTGLSFFKVTRIQRGNGFPQSWLDRIQVNTLMMMIAGQDPEWTDPATGDRWVSDDNTGRLVQENDSRVS